jgi:mitogen-activated protein kinase 1/3/mitogen-activated protein kinase 6
METDLASILKSSQPLTDDHCQFFLYQILRGMKYVHSAQVIHRDLKPRNLLVNANCDLKICDFGLARVNFTDTEFQTCPMTEYVCTRWYRAPEVLCSWTDYTSAIDIWSVGCIFAEMLGRKPLFPGHNTQHQLQLIINFLGTPHSEELRKIPNDKCRKFIESLPVEQGRKFEEAFQKASGPAIDFLHKTLQFDPDKRVTVQQALQHSYLSQLYCPEDEPTRPPLDTSDFEFERRKITIKALREELFLEAMQYYPDKLQRYLEEQMQSGQRYNIGDYRLLAPGESQYSSDEEGDA